MLGQLDREGTFSASYKRCTFNFSDCAKVETPLDPLTKIPTMAGFIDVEDVGRKLALQHNLLHPDNLNLSENQKAMLKWHWKLGHLGWGLLKEVGRRGILGKIGVIFTKYDPIKCYACQQGKQHRTSTEGHTSTRQNEGILSKDKLEPGDLVFLISMKVVCLQGTTLRERVGVHTTPSVEVPSFMMLLANI